jgi:uncharacterized protein YkwD
VSFWSKSALVATVLVLGCVPAAPLHATGAAKDSPCYEFTGKETDLARRINQARKRNDLREIHHDPELSKVARTNSKKMARRGALSHTVMSTLQDRVTREHKLGEAVVAAGTTKKMMKLLMGSPTHRALVLGSFRHYGVGIVKKKGNLWTTIVFSGRKNPGTTLEMPDC